jgi:hypothetical protein
MRCIAGWLILLTIVPKTWTQDSLARFVPKGALAFGEIVSLEPIAKIVMDSSANPWRDLVEQNPQIKKWKSSEDYEKVLAGIKLVEGVVGMDFQTLARKLATTRVAVALYPPEKKQKQPDSLLVIYYPDRELWSKLRPQLETLVTLTSGGKLTREAKDGRQIVSIDSKLFYFAETDVVVISNQKSLLEQSAPLAKQGSKGSLAEHPNFQENKNRSAGNVARFFLDNKKLRSLAKDGRWIPEKTDNFVIGTLLLQDSTELLATCDAVCGAIDVDSKGIRITTTIPGKPTRLGKSFAGFFLSTEEAGSPPIPRVKGYLSGLTVHRDIYKLYVEREQLVRESSLPDFDKFESGLNNVIPGKNFAEDLLPMMGRQITLIAANREFTGNAEPAIKLPAFAMIVELSKPKEGSDFFQMFFQAIVPIMNATARESGNKPQIIAMEKHNGTDVYFARYLEEPVGKKLPIQVNFKVSSATIGNHYILATAPELCKELVDALANPPARLPDGRNLVWNFIPTELARSLSTNLESMIANQIREGKSMAQAKAEMETLVAALKSLGTVELFTRVRSDDFQISLEANWK